MTGAKCRIKTVRLRNIDRLHDEDPGKRVDVQIQRACFIPRFLFRILVGISLRHEKKPLLSRNELVES
jgi:hypothetical protein